jgi:chemotaxis family two-component system sensor kinase Cph1
MTQQETPHPKPLGDLDTCAQEPIHIPGAIQPRGALLAVREPDLTVVAASSNLADMLGMDASAAVGRALSDVIGSGAGAVIDRAVEVFGELRNPLEVIVPVRGAGLKFDAILNRSSDGVLLIELEPTPNASATTVRDTYFAVRLAISDLDHGTSLSELYDVTVRAVRGLTGFDRVMVYRYDDEFNGEVVAEDRRDDLEPFLGLHFPASDIPVQARRLYEKKRTRLISDVDYVPAMLVSKAGAQDANPLDLTYSTLRSVSPIHLEYLRNMGVRASMSISLLHDGALWGLVACHHYSSAHVAPYGIRSAAAFVASSLSVRVADHRRDELLNNRSRDQTMLAKLTAATLDPAQPIAGALLAGPTLLDLIPADGVVVAAEGQIAASGTVPDDAMMLAIAAWMRSHGEDVLLTDSLAIAAPELGAPVDVAAGVLAVPLPDGQFVIWFRGERRESMDWGGDPQAKVATVMDGGTTRIGPRTSFARWRQEARQRSQPWSESERTLATELRTHLVEMLYTRTQHDLRLAETLQRSLLPQSLPAIAGWTVSAHYDTAEAGHVGGDWYDALVLSDGSLAAVLGDVAGHGIAAAGIMAQLRNALRAILLETQSPSLALERLNRFMTQLLPQSFATAAVARIDTVTGRVQLVKAGHLSPLVISASGAITPARIPTSFPLGVYESTYAEGEFILEPGSTLVMFSDGLVERRNEALDAGLERLAASLTESGPLASAPEIFAAAIQPGARDDTTVLAIHRHPIRTATGAM